MSLPNGYSCSAAFEGNFKMSVQFHYNRAAIPHNANANELRIQIVIILVYALEVVSPPELLPASRTNEQCTLS